MSSQGTILGTIPLPLGDVIAKRPRKEFLQKGIPDPQEGMVSTPWVEYMTRSDQILAQSPNRLNSVGPLTAQAASIGATDFSTGGLNAGLYRLSYYARITQAATTSSSLIVTFDWTDTGVATSHSFAAITGNTTATNNGSPDSKLIYSDAASPIRYSTTYASVGGTPMQYSLQIVLEKVQA